MSKWPKCPLSKPDLTEKGKEIRFGVLTKNHSTFLAKRLTATATLMTATFTTTTRKGLLSHEWRRLSGKSIRWRRIQDHFSQATITFTLHDSKYHLKNVVFSSRFSTSKFLNLCIFLFVLSHLLNLLFLL